MAALVDTHCHLQFAAFDSDRAEMLMRAHQVGVAHVVVPGVSAATWAAQCDFAKRYQHWHNAFGLHPYFIDQHQMSDVDALRALLAETPSVAVGEIGLDATCPNITLQRDIFEAQLALAKDFDLPVILHHRKTLDELLKHVRCHNIQHGVVHAFSGSKEQANAWVEQGFMLGIGGVITYSRANKTRAAVAAAPLGALVLETDSPDMPTAGKHGQRNEPAYLTRVFDALCELREESPAELRHALWQNSTRLFDLKR